MQLFLEFLIEHWTLAGAWMMVLFLLLRHENSKSGASVGCQQLSNLINKEGGVVLDVRDANDFKRGHIVDAISIPFRDIDKRSSELSDYQSKPVIVVCKMGQHSGSVSKQLKAKGFEHVYKLSGGMSEWTATSLPLVKS